MTSSENIRNAFHVVYKTYENVQKLIDYCKTIGHEKSNYVNVVDKFLRYKSDNDLAGWFIQDFILLFQNKNDVKLDNEWREGPIYVMEIELYDATSELETMINLPCVRLSKFEYETMHNWSPGCSPVNHWRFYYPLRNKELMNIVEDGTFVHVTPKNSEVSSRDYWGVKNITSKRIPLTDITVDNVIEKIFRTFDGL